MAKHSPRDYSITLYPIINRSYKASRQGSPDISASKPQGAQRGKEVAERFQKQHGPAHSSFQASSLQKCEAIDLLVLRH